MKKRYPELAKCKGLAPGFGVGSVALSNAQFSVDLTKIEGDGGGMQYTTLEALDAGAIPIVSHEWINCAGPVHDLRLYSVGSAAELADRLNSPQNTEELNQWRLHNRSVLDVAHSPRTVSHQYMSILKGA
jgi:hypothetical protein